MVTKAEISLVRSLSQRGARTQNGLFVAEGRKLVQEVMQSDFRIRAIYTTGDSVASEAIAVSPKDMERMSHLKTPTEAIALVEIPIYKQDINPNNELILALDNIQDPGNMGTIIRLADWFGIRNIVCSPSTVDCYNPKVVQATMGAILRTRVHYCNLDAALKNAVSNNIPVYGTFLEGENIYDSTLEPNRGVIVMGNEGNGISPTAAQYITHRLFIPPYPATESSASESLNVAIATAVVCSEFRRRK